MKITLLPVLLMSLVALVAAPALAEAPDDYLATVAVAGRTDVERLANLGVDIAEVGDGVVTIVTRPADQAQLEAAGFAVTPTRESAASLRARFAPDGKAAADAGLYHTYAEACAEMRDLAQAHPKLAKVEILGKSFEGREILALRISGAPAGKKVPKVLVAGMHHAREWMTVEVPLALAQELLGKYGKDERITRLVNERAVHIVPIVNPDGHIWSQTQYSYWRKNRNDNNGNKAKGVDPNRNYGYQWGTVGASTSPSSDTYHGTGPFSEPCTQAIKRLAEREKFVADVTIHSYGQLILYPWSYAYNQNNPDRDLFLKLGAEMAKHNGCTVKESCDLYPAMGDTSDFMYGQTASLSFTYEICRQFIPAESEIARFCADNTKALLALIEAAGAVHARAHPDYATALRFRAHQLAHLAGVAEKLGATEAAGPKALLSALDETRSAMLAETRPAADAAGDRLAELSAIARGFDPPARAALRPVLQELKNAYLQEASSARGAKGAAERARTLDELLAL